MALRPGLVKSDLMAWPSNSMEEGSLELESAQIAHPPQISMPLLILFALLICSSHLFSDAVSMNLDLQSE
jgi:hypothetical protein